MGLGLLSNYSGSIFQSQIHIWCAHFSSPFFCIIVIFYHKVGLERLHRSSPMGRQSPMSGHTQCHMNQIHEQSLCKCLCALCLALASLWCAQIGQIQCTNLSRVLVPWFLHGLCVACRPWTKCTVSARTAHVLRFCHT